jgi:glutamate N-acetyltransferase/amino-acid N-acetyltransferase
MALTLKKYKNGAITHPEGFIANGVNCGFKAKGILDLAFLYCVTNVSSAGVFTKNAFKAHPVVITNENLKVTKGKIKGVIVNSGNANALNGQSGFYGAKSILQSAAKLIKIKPVDLAICSTGLIGQHYPYEKALSKLNTLISLADSKKGDRFAKAILTTDKKTKEILFKGKNYSIGAACKGAGMISPNMATMLCFITTDAKVSPIMLQSILKNAVNETFNLLSVDGVTSTNDTILAFASNQKELSNYQEFSKSFKELLSDLCYEIAADAEGATKVITIKVDKAKTQKQAEKIARSIANSLLVKTSLFGSDPYWGRIAAQIGQAEPAIDPKKVEIYYGNYLVFKNLNGVQVNLKELNLYIKKKEIQLRCSLNSGNFSSTFVTTDLGFEYIKENMGRS